MPNALPERSRPATGVFGTYGAPTIVFVTVCTRKRVPWLASDQAHKALLDAWMQSTAWLVGRYVLMPDHLHLFAAPSNETVELNAWVRHWKSIVSKQLKNDAYRWQRAFWDTRLRREDSYAGKWDYMYRNPVRRGLVERPEDWPYAGELNAFRW